MCFFLFINSASSSCVCDRTCLGHMWSFVPFLGHRCCDLHVVSWKSMARWWVYISLSCGDNVLYNCMAFHSSIAHDACNIRNKQTKKAFGWSSTGKMLKEIWKLLFHKPNENCCSMQTQGGSWGEWGRENKVFVDNFYLFKVRYEVTATMMMTVKTSTLTFFFYSTTHILKNGNLAEREFYCNFIMHFFNILVRTLKFFILWI